MLNLFSPISYKVLAFCQYTFQQQIKAISLSTFVPCSAALWPTGDLAATEGSDLIPS